MGNSSLPATHVGLLKYVCGTIADQSLRGAVQDSECALLHGTVLTMLLYSHQCSTYGLPLQGLIRDAMDLKLCMRPNLT